MTEQTMTRAEARAQGLKRYFTGKSCKHGHVAERFIDGTCVPCRLAQNARWAKSNPDKKAASVRAFREKNADTLKAKQREYHAEWYAKNREIKLAQNKAYLQENPEVARRSTAKWRANNPEKAASYAKEWYSCPENRAVHHNRRRALEAQAGGSHTAADIREIAKAQGHRCAYCRCDLRKTKKHLDHIMPLALGGSNDRTNLQYLCAHCNLSKGAKDPIVFAQGRGLLL